jgi:hypothetical protein
MAELGYKIYNGNKNEKEKGSTSGNPLPKVAAGDIMKHYQEKNPHIDYWLVEVECASEAPKSGRGYAGKQKKVMVEGT